MVVGLALVVYTHAVPRVVSSHILRKRHACVGPKDMSNEQYQAGEDVPDDICSIPNEVEIDQIEFAVSVDVFNGYGGAKHIYPTTKVESSAALFSLDGTFRESLIPDHVQLYTVPHETLG